MIKNILKRLKDDQKGQISVEYLVMIVFGMILVITTGIIILNLNSYVTIAKAKILTYRDNILSTL
jgi:Flp pilus assembly pilin Flp